jgi:hypothetical protein
MMSTMKRTIIYILAIFFSVSLNAQKKEESAFRREVTLYNPYKPSLPDVVKKSFLPDMNDTAKVRPDFKYNVKTFPFSPAYTVSPIKAAALLPDALPKLYNSYINIGMGNFLSPLGELNITNQRSKKGNIGLYAKHFSTNGNVELQNLKKAFAGYMDNDVVLYGRKFFKSAILRGNIDFIQKTRHAYGYDTSFVDYNPGKKDIKLNFYNTGASIGLASMKLDSSKLAYDMAFDYHFFHSGENMYQNFFGFSGEASKNYKGFYMGGKLKFSYYNPSDSVSLNTKFIAAVSPFVIKKTKEWNMKLGFQALVNKSLEDENGKLHIYPDVAFGFSIVPSYLGFFAELSGRMEQNDPLNVIGINPFVIPDETLYKIRNSNYGLIVNAGLKGETGIEGLYRVSASYSIVNDMLFFSNSVVTDGNLDYGFGNYFIPVYDEVEILNIHGDLGGRITDKISFETAANIYKYTLAENEYAWNNPNWDGNLRLKYNLRNKIIAKADFNILGERKLLVTNMALVPPKPPDEIITAPVGFYFNLSAEYRYTNILSFWLKFNNISFSKYYEWAYYPTQRFLCQVGFTYSL